MVLVDIYVPSVDKTYNFSLNETVSVASIITEITEMIEQKEKVTLIGDKGQMTLYDEKFRKVIPGSDTLTECSVKSGSRLILV